MEWNNRLKKFKIRILIMFASVNKAAQLSRKYLFCSLRFTYLIILIRKNMKGILFRFPFMSCALVKIKVFNQLI